MFTEKQIQNFLSKTQAQENGCIHHLAKSKKHGYPYVHLRIGSGVEVRTSAHRVAWIIKNGPIQGGLYVLHKCDNRMCCNPDHLFLGTHQDNMDDMRSKGRSKLIGAGRDYELLQSFAQSESAQEKRRETFARIGHQRGAANSQHGTYWITNGLTSQRWRDSLGEIPDGFKRGRVQKST
jgi:hypothetical protein